MKRSRYEIAPRHGLSALLQTWMQMLAEQFVRKTRFDPLHEAGSEQRLSDRLLAWLGELREAERTGVAMQFGERALEIELERAQVIAAAEPHYGEVLRLVQAARVAGMPIELRVSERIASLPGLLDRLGSLRDCAIQVLPPGAAALGALQYETAIARSAEALALVYQLPTPRAATEQSVSDVESTPAPLRPTHVLFQGRAWRVTEQPLVVGWSVDTGRRALACRAPLRACRVRIARSCGATAQSRWRTTAPTVPT